MKWMCANYGYLNEDTHEYCRVCDLLKEDSDYAKEEYNGHSIYND